MDSKQQPVTELDSTGKRPKRMPPNAGKGRKKGVPNKVTTTAREAIAMLADGMTEKLGDWLLAAANGVGRAWALWDGESPLPEGAKKIGKHTFVPVLDDDGLPLRLTLSDVVAGKLPPGATIEWIVKPDPGGATDTMLRALEYHIPKLSRAEVTGKDGAPLVPAKIEVVGVKARERNEDGKDE